jgi:phosphatidylinositol alpha 1,6-mannosyltransferase
MNGVTRSVVQTLRHLQRRGHEALVIAPQADGLPEVVHGARVVAAAGLPLPGYPQVRVSTTGARRLAGVLADFEPDVAHLASPFVLGWRGLVAASGLGVPTVAIYQTDVPGYAAKYGVPGLEPGLSAHVARLHRRATLTLAPSSAAEAQLAALGVPRVARWARGVDTAGFRPEHRSDAWRRGAAPGGETIVGYVGRLAPEKQVEDLSAIADLPGTRLVIVGDGPDRARLERVLPDALFTGFLEGTALAEVLASLDVFVHPGEHETFGQTIQEAHASEVPVVATGRGGPLDLVRNSLDGWLYPPGQLTELRARVQDLVGDDAKRRAFGEAARAAVAGRSWTAVGDELIEHYRHAKAVAARGGATVPTGPAPASPMKAGPVTDGPVTAGPMTARPMTDGPVTNASWPAVLGAAAPVPDAPATRRAPVPPTVPDEASVQAGGARPVTPRWRRFVALGDSVTEGIGDTSRMPAGEYRGWADRLAELVAAAGRAPIGYANLAVRSRRVADVVDDQVPHALALGADLVSVLIGGNDLVRAGARPVLLADRVGATIARLRAAGCDVLVVTAFMPARPPLRAIRARFRVFNERLAGHAERHGAMLLDVGADEALVGVDRWSPDRVHLNSAGHRALAYAAAEVLGVPDAVELAALDAALHAEDGPDRPPLGTAAWVRLHAAPWVIRRLRGRTAGDGRAPKHDTLVAVGRGDGSARQRAGIAGD